MTTPPVPPVPPVPHCPGCGQAITTRVTPSGATRLIRHSIPDRSMSCTGSGWLVHT